MEFTIFVDLDGVLADFDQGVKKLTGKLPAELSPRQMWPRIAGYPNFYGQLQWMPDGEELWNQVKGYHPVILTGLPIGKWAEPQKRDWCARMLGEEIPVITCMSRDKAKKAREYTGEEGTIILIDDRDKLKEAWEQAGGIFIHHTDTFSSLKKLFEIIG